jgi:hypothetical protein
MGFMCDLFVENVYDVSLSFDLLLFVWQPNPHILLWSFWLIEAKLILLLGFTSSICLKHSSSFAE